MKKVKVVQDEQDVVEIPVLAKAIIAVSDSMRQLLKSGINRRAVITLVCESASFKAGHYYKKPTKNMVEAILCSLEDLAKNYCGGAK